jgi:CubicO group peptidase (beta-lactamase class C family)
MRERVFEPSSMSHTRTDDVFALVPNRARGYSPRVYGQFDGRVRNADLMDTSYKTPGGGLLSTAEDLARFAIAAQSGKLLGKQSLAVMAKSGRTSDGKDTGYGYGWSVGTRENPAGGAIWHSGGQSGFTSELWMLPDRGFAVAILTNLEGGGQLGLNTLAKDIAAIVLR